MKPMARGMVALALIAVASWDGMIPAQAATKKPIVMVAAAMDDVDAQERAEAAKRKKDPAWQPITREVAPIQVGNSKKPGALRNFCLNTDGNLLVCFAPVETGPKNAPGLRVYSPEGRLLKTIPLKFKPEAVCVAKGGLIFVAGSGQLAKLDASGEVLASADSPLLQEPIVLSKESEEMIKLSATQYKRSIEQETSIMKATLEQRRNEVTGLTATDEDVFLAVPSPNDFSFRVYRLDHALRNPKLVVDKLRGCCKQMDIQSHDGKLLIPHNARHSVETRDRDGKELFKFGTAGRTKASDFGGCCEPKNIRVLANGDILAAESGPPTCIKRFSPDGKFQKVVALAENAKGDCVRVTVGMSPDARRYYMLDTTRDAIRVFAAKD